MVVCFSGSTVCRPASASCPRLRTQCPASSSCMHDVASCTANITSHLHTTISKSFTTSQIQWILHQARAIQRPASSPHLLRGSGPQHIPMQYVAVRIQQTLTVMRCLLCAAQIRLCVAGWQVVWRNLGLFVRTLPLRMLSEGSKQTLRGLPPLLSR